MFIRVCPLNSDSLNLMSNLNRPQSPEHTIFPEFNTVSRSYLCLQRHCSGMGLVSALGRTGFLPCWKQCKDWCANLRVLQMDTKMLSVSGWESPPLSRLSQEQPKNEPRLQVEHPRPALGSRSAFGLSQRTNSQLSLQILAQARAVRRKWWGNETETESCQPQCKLSSTSRMSFSFLLAIGSAVQPPKKTKGKKKEGNYERNCL